MKAFIFVLVVLFIAGGFPAVFQGLDVLWQTLIQIMPIFEPAFKQALGDYLTSKRFVVGVILILLSSAGIYLTCRERKWLYFAVSIVVDIVSLVSVISNLAACS